MKIRFARTVLLGLLLQIGTAAPAKDVAVSPPAEPTRSDELAALEKKLHGPWRGPACGGDYTFNADGTFELKHFTPGNNTLTGTWSIRWDALPPTLILTCKTSDFKTKDAGRDEYEYLGTTREAKLVELNEESVAYRIPNDKSEWRFTRRDDEGGSVRRLE
jgi:hypothetical protein